MRNLRVIHHLAHQDELDRPPSAYCWDLGSNSVLCTYGPTENDTLIELKRWHNHDSSRSEDTAPQTIASWDAPCPSPDLSHDLIVCLQHFADTATTCLVFAGGDIVLVREKPLQEEEKIEIVGSIDVGISAAAWAPDEELLVICTQSDTLLFMTRDFDSSETIEFSHDDLKASKHVSVGWGKSETQFKGKGAKALRDPTVPEKVDEGLPSPRENHRTTITWRGDGQFVAVNSVRKSDRRVSRVYTRDGVLDAVSEPVNFLDSTLSWRPSGNILAGVQRNGASTRVVFFERNGLRHGEFSLRLSESDCLSWASDVSLYWNMDSTVLAISYRDRVQLWTMSNYHYSLKQEIYLSSELCSHPFQVSWHPENSLSFLIGSVTGNAHRIELVSSVCHAETLGSNGNGAIAVIDGATLKLTPMKYSNIPPPMALHELDSEHSIIDAAFHTTSAKVLSLVVLTSRDIIVYDWNVSKNSEAPTQRFIAPLSSILKSSVELTQWQQVQFPADDTILILHSAGCSSVLTHLRITATSFQEAVSQSLPLTQEVACFRGELELDLAIQHNGRVLKLSNTNGQNGTSSQIKPVDYQESVKIKGTIESCQLVQLPRGGSDISLKPQVTVVTITKGGHLYADKRQIASGCTSFLVTAAHIIFTTSHNLLKFVHLTSVDEMDVPPDTPESDERCRALERGARLITVIPSTSALILQMPRGNLETIFPRAMVLGEIRRSIDNKRYLRAFKLCRTHRVDMNILHDYKPEQFLSDVPLFIQQVQKVEFVDLFLSQLREEDVSIAMYRETANALPSKATTSHVTGDTKINLKKSKVNNICNAFLKALRPLMATNLQNLITSHVCKSPPDLSSGLREVARLQTEDPKQAELAVEHICFLVDVNKLYDAALGLYDIKLALLVAQQAQKDPKEYLPFLQKLTDYPELKMKFEIDNHLSKYRLCLQHLKDLGDFEEFKNFMVRHEFYGEGLSMYKYHDKNVDEIMRLYAEYLTGKSHHQEAGVAYEYLQDYSAACESYRLAHSWREALSCANAIQFGEEEVGKLARDMADGLIELKDFHAAGTIHLEYLNDVKTAAQLFCKGYHFADATRVLSLNGKADLIASVVDAGLIEAMAATTETLAECKAQLNAQIPRLRELRTKKEQDPLSFYDADVNGGADIPDNVSLAGTDASTVGSTLFTRYTNRSGTVGTNATRRTSKNKRREERKRARGKKGSVYEEEYLINSIGRLIERINSINGDVKRLVLGLVRRRMMERARAVESSMLTMMELCNVCIPEVFQAQIGIDKGPTRDIGGQGDSIEPKETTIEMTEEERTNRTPPTVTPFEGLSILKDSS